MLKNFIFGLFFLQMAYGLHADVDDLTKAKIVSQSKVRQDQDTRKAVSSAIFGDAKLTQYAKNIDVKVEDRVVSLTGFVPSVEIKNDVEHKVLAVPGVSSVHNYIEIKGHNTSTIENYTPEA